MCDDGISHDQYERMRQSFATLRAAAQRVLACEGRPVAADAVEAFAALRAAVVVDPASFTVVAPPSYRILLKPGHQ